MATAGALLAVASISQAVGEIVPYFASGVGDRQKFEAIVTGAFEPAASKWSRDLYMDDCIEVPRSFFALAQPPAMRKRMLMACNTNAREVVRSTPNASNAWVVLAATSAEFQDFATMRSALAISKQTAPNLQWLADRRTWVVEAYPGELDDAGQADYESDIAVLASGKVGMAVLAQRYARNEAVRDTYIRVLDKAPPDRKRHFLSAIRAEMAS
jgi:hypothetical protein